MNFINSLKETLDFYRGLILDAVEAELDDSQNWGSLRSRLLKLLGDRGLESKVLAIFKAFENGVNIQ